jgi:hypothetical protein
VYWRTRRRRTTRRGREGETERSNSGDSESHSHGDGAAMPRWGVYFTSAVSGRSSGMNISGRACGAAAGTAERAAEWEMDM